MSNFNLFSNLTFSSSSPVYFGFINIMLNTFLYIVLYYIIKLKNISLFHIFLLMKKKNYLPFNYSIF